MSSQKKKNKKKTPSSSGKVSKSNADDDEFADVVTYDDDGSISTLDCLEISKLIFSIGKQLSKTATAFLEVFKNRCSLTVGSALVTFYDLLSNVNCDEGQKAILFRVVLVYLIYRVRELEPTLKRKQDKSEKGKDSIMGHPFIDFFLGLTSDNENLVEILMASRILSKRGHELGSLLPMDIVKASELSNNKEEKIDVSEIEHFLLSCQIRWPVSYEYNLLPSTVSNCGRSKPDLNIGVLTIEELACMGEKILVNSPGLMPPRDLGLYEMMSFLEPSTHEYEHNPRPGPCDHETDVEDMYALNQQIEHVRSLDTNTSNALKWNVDIVAEDSKGHITTGHSVDMTTTEKIVNGQSLSPNEIRAMLKVVNDCSLDDPILERLKVLDGGPLRKFIEDNVKVASEAAFKIVSKNPDLIDVYMSVLLHMNVSVQSLELVRRLYENIPNLNADALREYVFSIMNYCQYSNVSSSQLTRTVRMICMFVTSLVKHGLLKDSSILTGIQEFVLKYRDVKEATILYQIIVSGCGKLPAEQ